MYKFFSSLSDQEVNRRYLNLFRLKSFDKKFHSAITSIPELNSLFPSTYTGSTLLTLNFDELTNIYYKYIDILQGLSKVRRERINNTLSKVFNYPIHRSKIKKFLCDPNNGFEIYNCVYCDIQQFQKVEKNGSWKIAFHTDHVLDEGKCPLVGLSIHNFVPACDVCNEGGNKGIQTLGRSKKETLKISPKSHRNNFDQDVEFYFTPSCEKIKDLKMFRGDVGWEIDLRHKVVEYSRTIELFHLKDRYNAKKKYFGKYVLLRKDNPDTKIKQDAQLLGRLFTYRVEELFDFDENRRNHAPMEKCRRDLIKQVYGKLPSGS